MFIHSPNELHRAHQISATGQRMREHNTQVLLRLIWQAAEGISRAELARQSGMSRSTVSGITSELLQADLIAEGSVARSTGGRPSINLDFRLDRFAVIGVELGGSHVACVRTNMHGTIEERLTEACPVRDDPAGTLQLMHRLIRTLLDSAGADRPAVGLGLAVPCPLASSAPGQLSDRILPAWAGIELGHELFEHYQVPVLIDNDANLGALAEAWWGAGQGVEHFTFVKVATGIGAGHIIGGEIFRGTSGIAGEIGHSTVDPQGRPCRCGLAGCLEAEVGSRSILEQVRERLAEGVPSMLSGNTEADLHAVVSAARDGDPLATEVIANAGHHLGVALANLVNLMNPARVILGGRVTLAGELLMRPLRRAMAHRALASSVEDSEVRISELGPWAIAQGAATLVVQWALRNPHVFAARSPHAEPRASTRLLSAQSNLR